MSAFHVSIPSGIGLHYLVSGLFTAVEQFVFYLFAVRKLAV